MAKKVIILCNNFIPYSISLGAASRVLKMARVLRGLGTEVFVAAAKREMEHGYFGYEEELKKINLSYIEELTVNPILDFFFGKKTDVKSLDSDKMRNLSDKSPSTRNMVDGIIGFLSVPDPKVYSVKRYYERAVEIIEKNGIRNIITTSPHHSLHLAGFKIKRKYGKKVNWIVDYRDSWNTRTIYARKLPPFNWISRRMEKKVLLACDHFTYVSEPMLRRVNGLLGLNIEEKSLLVMSGYLPEDYVEVGKGKTERKSMDKKQPVKIGYFGSLNYFNKNPVSYLRILEKLTKDSSETHRDFRIEIYGQVPFKLKNEITEILGSRVSLLGTMDHKQAIDKMKEMDYLLIVDSERDDAEEVLTGKFFDYICAAKPMIAVGSKNMQVSKMVTEYGLGSSMDIDNESEILEKMKEMLSINYKGWLRPQNADLKLFSSEYQFKIMSDLLVE